MPHRLYDATLFADYHQIYLCDAAHPELPEDYSDATMANRLAVGPHGVVLHTARNMEVPVQVQWHTQRPDTMVAHWQHVVEAGFEAPSGQLVLAGLTDYAPDAARLQVTAGPIGIRVSLSGLDTLSADGLDGEDRYLIDLWPRVEPAALRVLKRWEDT